MFGHVIWELHATSGPNGENPSGLVRFSNGPAYFGGPVTCLNVSGDTATITFVSDPSIISQPPINAEGNITVMVTDGQPDTFVAGPRVSTPTECPLPLRTGGCNRGRSPLTSPWQYLAASGEAERERPEVAQQLREFVDAGARIRCEPVDDQPSGYWETGLQPRFLRRFFVSLMLAWIIARFASLPALASPCCWRFSFLRSFLHFGSSPAAGVGLGGVGFAV